MSTSGAVTLGEVAGRVAKAGREQACRDGARRFDRLLAADDRPFDIETEAIDGCLDRGGRVSRTWRGADGSRCNAAFRRGETARITSRLIGPGRKSAVSVDQIGCRARRFDVANTRCKNASPTRRFIVSLSSECYGKSYVLILQKQNSSNCPLAS